MNTHANNKKNSILKLQYLSKKQNQCQQQDNKVKIQQQKLKDQNKI